MSHRTYRRTIRRHNRRTYVYPAIGRAFGWLALFAFVGIVSGLGAVHVGAWMDTDHTPDTYTYVPSATCPTEDSCRPVFAWTGDDYEWTEVPYIP